MTATGIDLLSSASFAGGTRWTSTVGCGERAGVLARADGRRHQRRATLRHGARDHRLRRDHPRREARRPGRRFASRLVTAEVDGRTLAEQEFASFFLLLVNAGGDTTRNLVGGAMVTLLERPELLKRLRAEVDTLLPTALEELLRFQSPVSTCGAPPWRTPSSAASPSVAGDDKVGPY